MSSGRSDDILSSPYTGSLSTVTSSSASGPQPKQGVRALPAIVSHSRDARSHSFEVVHVASSGSESDSSSEDAAPPRERKKKEKSRRHRGKESRTPERREGSPITETRKGIYVEENLDSNETRKGRVATPTQGSPRPPAAPSMASPARQGLDCLVDSPRPSSAAEYGPVSRPPSPRPDPMTLPVPPITPKLRKIGSPEMFGISTPRADGLNTPRAESEGFPDTVSGFDAFLGTADQKMERLLAEEVQREQRDSPEGKRARSQEPARQFDTTGRRPRAIIAALQDASTSIRVPLFYRGPIIRRYQSAFIRSQGWNEI